MRSLAWGLALVLLAAPLAAADPISRAVDGYAVLADTLLRTKGSLTVDGGPLGVNAGSLLTHGPLAAGPVDVVAGAGPANAVRLRPGSACRALFTDPARVTGVNCSSSPVAAFTGPILDEPLADACGFPGTIPACTGPGVTVAHGAVVHLAGGTPAAPRAYGAVLVQGAPTPGTLVLDGGTYVFCGLRVAGRAQLLIGSAVQVFVAGDLQLYQSTIVGPDSRSAHAPAAADIRFLVAGGRAHLSRRTHFTGHLCAPNGIVSMAAGAEAFGGLAGHIVSTDRAIVHGIPAPPPTTTTTTTTSTTSTTVTSTTTTSTSTTVTTTTSTTVPSCVCGDGRVDPGCEQCDLGSPGGGILEGTGCPDGQVCVECQCVATTTTTTVSTTTTSTTLPCRCGDGIVEPACGEQCDSASGSVVDQCPAGSRCTATCTCEPTAPAVPPLVCNTCADFQNPACCAQSTLINLRRGRFGRRGKGTRVNLHSLVGQSGFRPVLHRDDVLIQLRQGSTELLCAEVPAAKFMKMHHGRTIGFWDYRHHVPSAKHIDDVAFTARKKGGVKVHVFGRKAELQTPAPGDLTLMVVLRNPSAPAESQCAAVTQSFRTTRTQGLRAP